MFKQIVITLSSACLAAWAATGMAQAAQSPFIGQWKLDPSRTRLPDEMKVESQGGGKYAFDFGGGLGDDRSGWDIPAGLRQNPLVGEG